jgi:hypothetical protein
MTGTGESERTTVARVKELLDQQVPNSYAARSEWSERLQQLVQELIIERLEQPFNEEFARRAHATLGEKQELCRWANRELRSKGLAIRCPKTGQIAFIYGDRGNHPEIGRFQLELAGRRRGHQRTLSQPTVFRLFLCNALSTGASRTEYWSRKIRGELASDDASPSQK